MELRLNRHGTLVAKAVAFLLLMGICAPVFSADILVVGSSTSKTSKKVTQALRESFKKQCELSRTKNCTSVHIDIVAHQNLQTTDFDKSDYKLIVSLGQTAAKAVQKEKLSIPHLYTLISERLYREKLRIDAPAEHSAIFLDQRLSRQLTLCKIIKRNPHLGVLLREPIGQTSTKLHQLATNLGIKLNLRIVTDTKHIGYDLKDLLRDSNILLALPDARIYNKKTIFNILLSSYHSQIPLIGFSSAYVKAGAVAAVYSSSRQIGTHIGELVFEFVTTDSSTLPGLAYAKYFSVSVNRQVAKSLGISLPSEDAILQTINEAEK